MTGHSERAAELLQIAEEIADLQRFESFILSGFYLEDADVQSLQEVLEEDDPDVGAEGRLLSVPVFRRTAFQPTANSGQHRGVLYTFIPMAVVD